MIEENERDENEKIKALEDKLLMMSLKHKETVRMFNERT